MLLNEQNRIVEKTDTKIMASGLSSAQTNEQRNVMNRFKELFRNMVELRNAWRETVERAKPHLSSFCQKRAEIHFISSSDFEGINFLEKNADVKKFTLKLLNECILEEKVNLTAIMEELFEIQQKMLGLCSKAFELYNAQHLTIDQAASVTEEGVSIADQLERFWDIEQAVINEYAVKKFTVECFLQQHDVNEEKVYRKWKDSCNWNTIL